MVAYHMSPGKETSKQISQNKNMDSRNQGLSMPQVRSPYVLATLIEYRPAFFVNHYSANPTPDRPAY